MWGERTALARVGASYWANEFTHVQQRAEDTVVLGEERFGIVHYGRCKKTRESTLSLQSHR